MFKNIFKTKYLYTFILLLLFFSLPKIVLTNEPSGIGDAFKKVNEFAEISGYSTESSGALLDEIIINIITIVLSIVGLVFVILIIYSGFNWMTAGGVEEKVTKAKKTIKSSLIGLIVVMASYAISYFILEFVIGSTLDD